MVFQPKKCEVKCTPEIRVQKHSITNNLPTFGQVAELTSDDTALGTQTIAAITVSPGNDAASKDSVETAINAIQTKLDAIIAITAPTC